MTLKICIIGESGVGKTSLINRFTKNKFSSQYRITVGADLFSHEMTVDDNEYSLQVSLTRSGTPPGRRSSNPSGPLSIEEVMHVFWSLTLPVQSLSTSWSPGKKSSSTRGVLTMPRTSLLLCLGTNATGWTRQLIKRLQSNFVNLMGQCLALKPRLKRALGFLRPWRKW